MRERREQHDSAIDHLLRTAVDDLLRARHSDYTPAPYRERNDSERLARAIAKRERRAKRGW